MNVQLPSLHLSKQWFGTNWLLMWCLPNHAVAIQMKIINATSKEPYYSLKFNFLKSIHHTHYTLEEIYQEYIGFKWNVCIIYEILQNSVEFSHSVMSNSATPWTAACQASLAITNSQSLLKLMSKWVGDAIQSSHPLSSPSPPTFNLSQHQGLQVAKVLEFQLQHQSFQWIFRTDFL